MEELAHDFSDLIISYFAERKLKFPDFNDAIKFAITEIAEALEIDLAQYDYIRNNPHDKPEFDKQKLEEELGDVLMMIQLAGIVIGLNPMKGLIRKIERKLREE